MPSLELTTPFPTGELTVALDALALLPLPLLLQVYPLPGLHLRLRLPRLLYLSYDLSLFRVVFYLDFRFFLGGA